MTVKNEKSPDNDETEGIQDRGSLKGAVSIANIYRTYTDVNGVPVDALEDVSLEIRPGELISLIGPSGCGKTTLMRLIAGLDTPQNGSLSLDEAPIAGTDHERGYGFRTGSGQQVYDPAADGNRDAGASQPFTTVPALPLQIGRQ